MELFVHETGLTEDGKEGEGQLFLGYDDRSARPYALDLRSVYCLCLTGSDSGSLQIMRVFMESCKTGGKRKLMLLDLGSCFPACKDSEDIMAYGQTEDEVLEICRMLTDLFTERKNDGEGGREREYVFVFITGFPGLMNMAYQGETGLDGFLENIWEKGMGRQIVFLAQMDNSQIDALQMYRAFRLFCSGGRGFAAGGALLDLRLFSCTTLPYEEQLRVMDKRECYVFSGEEEIIKIIVPEVPET